MGNAVLAKLAFADVEYVLCETFDLPKEITKYYDSGKIYEYDVIFITDLWLEEPMLSTIAADENLKDRVFIFDHHKSALESDALKYPFVTIKIEDEKGLCCGTSLFYQYLVSKNLIDEDNKAIFDFIELVRKYDTWEWKTKYNDEMPHELTLLFDSVGCIGFIELMLKKLRKSNNGFSFDELECMLIENKKEQVIEKVSNYAKKLKYIEILDLEAGVVFIDYEYRNDLTEYLRQNGYEMDFVAMIALDYGTVSFRNIKDNVNVRLVAEALGGKGHDKASSCPIPEEEKLNIIKRILKKSQK